jgi:hypothetical protein
MFARSALARVGAISVTAVLAVTLAPAQSNANHTNGDPGPIHAGNTFGWYGSGVTRYEFHGAKESYWRVKGRGLVQNQHGMLTLNTSTRGSVSATLAKPGHSTGRWEIRLRSRRYETAHANYKVVTELVPAGTRDQHCGGRDIALENYKLGTDRAKFYIHTLPDNTFRASLGRNLGNDQWHTFAVEVTPKRISWFVDAHVIRSERRSAALSGVPLTVRFSMRAAGDARMNQSRMQMDWLRYWTLGSPNQKSTKAPQTELATFHAAC